MLSLPAGLKDISLKDGGNMFLETLLSNYMSTGFANQNTNIDIFTAAKTTNLTGTSP
jgi:hypothetical protein